MTKKQVFALDKFELYVHRRKYELAARELLKWLNMIDSQYGAWGDIGTRPSNDRSQDRRDRHVIVRTAAAIGALFADPDFKITLSGWGRSLFYHRWLQILFGACDFANADHILHLMKADSSNPNQMTYDDPALIKFSLLYSGDSQIPLQLETFWNKNPQFAAGLFMAILSNRVVISEAALKKKERLLEWLPEKIKKIELTDAHLPFLHDVWMHCSYAFTPKKHDIKEALNILLRKRLLAAGCVEPEFPKSREIKKKPTLLVPLEWFTSKHAMYRCYAPRIESLKKKFRLVALATPITIDDVSREIFDEVIEIERGGVIEQARKAVQKINELKPDMIYYPSVGMQLMIVALATLRLAPIQCMGLGHPASSRSDKIDYVVVRKDVIGDPLRFSEKIIATPEDSTPFTIPHGSSSVKPSINKKPDIVKIAVTASVMKLNPTFLKTCREINNRCDQEIEFHFFIGHGIGITKHYISNQIDTYLANTIIYPHASYDTYIENLNKCDIFLNPFPFGNTNGIVDTIRQGLPGVCMDGPEIHSHSDGIFFNLLGLPKWAIATDLESFISSAVRLASQHDERVKLSEKLLSINPDKILFEGNTDSFSDAIWEIYTQHEQLISQDRHLNELPTS